uniref:ABC transporter domain-containing protein n=1 Tax=Ciona savignyi TaxID=51511 RepID=H2Z564_CIOSA
VSGFAKPGSLLAVIGSSGSGKTTLLNVLNGRNAKSLDVTGEILANGVSMGPDISKISAYVQQDDLFMGELTVKEHLMFAARLRMEASLSSQDRVERVNDVMTQMRLVGCKNRRICTIGGDKVLSGGELKRLGVASELLAKPSILFLDEPTSGLDAFLAKVMVECLKQVSELGCTVICTIHQPSSEVFELFDDLMILSMGRVVYHGEAAAAMQHYTENGSVCPPNYNPADFYINELSFLPGDEDKAREKINKLADSFEKSERYKELGSLHSKSNEASNVAMVRTKNVVVSFLQQLLPCIERSFRISFRNYQLRARLISNSLAGLIMGLVYLRAYNTPYQSEEVLDVNGLFFLIIMTATINGLITSFPTQIDVAQREHRSALYSVLVFYLAKNIAELLSFILMPTLQCVLVYFMAGLYPGVREFFLFWLISVVVINTCVSLGYFISCISKSREMAMSLIAPFVLPTMYLTDHTFPPFRNVRIYLKWIKYISWFHYTNKLFMINQWSMV